MSMRIAAAMAATCLLACTGTAAASPAHVAHATRMSAEIAASRFTDGSFEAPNSGRYGPGEPLGSSMGVWDVTSGNVDLVGVNYWTPAEGDRSIDINGSTTGAVAQTFTTDPETTYTVTYALAGNMGDGSPTVKTGRVLVDGQNFQDFSFDTTGKSPTDMGYVVRQFTFVAVRETTTLTFTSTTSTDRGPVIDDVRVQSSSCGSCAESN